MNANFIGSEVTKRKKRMLDAIRKNCFRIDYKETYRVAKENVTVIVTLWEVWSTHTHRSPRLYIVTRTEENGQKRRGCRWECTCPDFEANGQWFPCKHILFVQKEEGL